MEPLLNGSFHNQSWVSGNIASKLLKLKCFNTSTAGDKRFLRILLNLWCLIWKDHISADQFSTGAPDVKVWFRIQSRDFAACRCSLCKDWICSVPYFLFTMCSSTTYFTLMDWDHVYCWSDLNFTKRFKWYFLGVNSNTGFSGVGLS